MAEAAKGTVTPFASVFPAEEAQKAAKRVEEEIAEKEKELGRIKEFIGDNTNLINLVAKLPEELHHNIMVPFGKAAFLPGRLIHTNEFMVLLGEGYYAERTSKQTIEILKRRGKALNSQVESLKANMKDLKAEASFFDATASEAAEGLVEIREDYVEENSSIGGSKSDGRNVTFEDDEYAHLMSRFDELEKEELAAEGYNDSDEGEASSTAETNNENEKEQEIDEAESESENDTGGHDQTYSQWQTREQQEQMKNEETTTAGLLNKHHFQPNYTDQLNRTGLTEGPFPKGSAVERSHDFQASSQRQTLTSSQAPVQVSKPGFDSTKAFTGSVVERADSLQTVSPDLNATLSQASNAQPSRPVSRFKLQRR